MATTATAAATNTVRRRGLTVVDPTSRLRPGNTTARSPGYVEGDAAIRPPAGEAHSKQGFFLGWHPGRRNLSKCKNPAQQFLRGANVST
jgi:hypothetical protein